MLCSCGKKLIAYGLFLVAAAMLAVAFDPSVGQVGFYGPALPALCAGVLLGAISIACGILIGQGKEWPLSLAVASTTVCAVVGSWRGVQAWLAFSGGQQEQWYGATLASIIWTLTAMMLASLVQDWIDANMVAESASSSGVDPVPRW